LTEPRTPIDEIERVRNLLAFLLVGAFISTLPMFVFKVIPAENKELVVYMVGQLSGMATLALGFYFVSKVGQDALDAKRADNTGLMATAVTDALRVGEKAGEPLDVRVANEPSDPANVKERP
jgi:hypothetical protein